MINLDRSQLGVHSLNSHMTFKDQRMRNAIASKPNTGISQQLHSKQISKSMILLWHDEIASVWLLAIWSIGQSLFIVLILPSPSQELFRSISHFQLSAAGENTVSRHRSDNRFSQVGKASSAFFIQLLVSIHFSHLFISYRR